MKKIIIMGIITLVTVLTNPNKVEHVDAIKQLILGSVNKQLLASTKSDNPWEVAGSALGFTLGLGLMEKMLESVVYRKNFLLFSLTEIRYDDETRIVGIGAFGGVWIFSELGNAIRSISDNN